MSTHPLSTIAGKRLGKTVNELDDEEHRVLISIQNRNTLSRDAADVSDECATFGQRLSDRVAAVGGSWAFIIIFFVVLLSWMLLNTDILAEWGMAFDPYPYIFLNLMLSMLAAIQAPVIMMRSSQRMFSQLR